jgi:tetratricopeptide (TPR) repeat protein
MSRAATSRNLSKRVLTASALMGLASAVGCASKPGGPSASVDRPVGIDHYIVAQNQSAKGNDEQAIASLKAALKENPNLRMANAKLGQIYMNRREYDKALPYLKQSTTLDPFSVRSHTNLGLAHQLLQQFTDAAVAYIRALKIDGNDFAGNMNLGLVYYSTGDLDSSVTYLERATRIDPKSARAWSNLGVVYDARGNRVLAEACYRQSIELDPDNLSTLNNLTTNLLEQKRGPDALAFAKQLTAVAPDRADFQLKLARAYALNMKWDESLAILKPAFQSNPRDIATLNTLAHVYLSRYRAELELDDKLRQTALNYWRQSLSIDPNQRDIAEQLKKWENPRVTDVRD